MSDFRDYEVIEQLADDIRLEIVRARKPGSRRIVLLKALKLDSLSGTQFLASGSSSHEELSNDPRLPYLDAVKAQAVAGRASNSNIAPIHDLFPTEEGVCFATDFYENGSLKRRIRLSDPSHLALQNVIGGILGGLLSLKSLANRGHGNLHTNNVMLGGGPGTPMARCSVFLTDIAPAFIQTPFEMERSDLRAVGQIIYQLVMRRVEDRKDGFPFPIRSSPEWVALGIKGEFWLRLCNRLLDPELTSGTESVEALLKEVGRPASPWRLRVAAAVILAALAGAGVYWALMHRPPHLTVLSMDPADGKVTVGQTMTWKFTIAHADSAKSISAPQLQQGLTREPDGSYALAVSNLDAPVGTSNILISDGGKLSTNLAFQIIPVPSPQLTIISMDPSDAKVTLGRNMTWKFKIENPSGALAAPQLPQGLTQETDGSYTLTASTVGGQPGLSNVLINDGGKLSTNLAFEVVAAPSAQLTVTSTDPGDGRVTIGQTMTWKFKIENPGGPVSAPQLNEQLKPDADGIYTLTTVPGPGAPAGPTNILVSDGAKLSNNLSFEVVPPPPPPTLNLATPTPLVMAPDNPSLQLAFSVGDGKIAPEKLNLSLELDPSDILDQQPIQVDGSNRLVTLSRKSGMSGTVKINATVTAGDRRNGDTFMIDVQGTPAPPALELAGPPNPTLDVNASNEAARVSCRTPDSQKLQFQVIQILPANSPLLDSAGVKFEPDGPSGGAIVLTPHRGYVGKNTITVRGSAAGDSTVDSVIELTVTGDIQPPRIRLSTNAITVEQNQTTNIQVTVEDDYFPRTNLLWVAEPDTENFVTVTPDINKGVLMISGKAPGTATVAILLTAPNGSNNTANLTAVVAPLPIVSTNNPPPVTGPIVPSNWYTNDETGLILVWVKDLPGPAGSVWLDGRTGGGWAGEYEVTQGQFAKVMGTNPSAHKAGDNFPVESMTLAQAVTFCSSLTTGDKNLNGWCYTLPSVEQWKFLAGPAPEKNSQNNYTNYANYNLSRIGKTIAVGSLTPNSLGLYDVLGNVSELTSSTYTANGISYNILKGGNFAKGSAPLLQLPALPEYYSKAEPTIGFRVILVPIAAK
jgi:hypothetical protein